MDVAKEKGRSTHMRGLSGLGCAGLPAADVALVDDAERVTEEVVGVAA